MRMLHLARLEVWGQDIPEDEYCDMAILERELDSGGSNMQAIIFVEC